MAIQFEDELDVKPIKSIDQHASGVDRGRDVVFSRTISNTSRFSKNKSDWADGDDEEKDSGIRRESDYKQKQIFTGSKLLFLAYQSM
jgi:KUP system potassium uptake protein